MREQGFLDPMTDATLNLYKGKNTSVVLGVVRQKGRAVFVAQDQKHEGFVTTFFI